MRTVNLGTQRLEFRLEQGSSSSVEERRLDRPEWEWLRLLEGGEEREEREGWGSPSVRLAVDMQDAAVILAFWNS